MPDTTKYDKIVVFLLDNWIVSIIVVIAVVIASIPSLRDGIVQISKFMKTIFSNKTKDYVIKYDCETITFEYKTKSTLFDIVKINAITHGLGVRAEYQWVRKYYPNYTTTSQGLSKIKVNENLSLHFDTLTIINDRGQQKNIYFDISEFFNDAGHTSADMDKFARAKIKELHEKNKKSA